MGPGDQDSSGDDRPDTGERGEPGCLGGDERVEQGTVSGEVTIEGTDVLGRPDCLVATGGQPGGLVTGTPAGDHRDLSCGQGAAGVDSEVDCPQQRSESVDPSGPVGGHVLSCHDQHGQRDPRSGVCSGTAQLVHADAEYGASDPERVQLVILAHPVPGRHR